MVYFNVPRRLLLCDEEGTEVFVTVGGEGGAAGGRGKSADCQFPTT